MSDARSMIAQWKSNPPMSKSERDALRNKGDYPAELWYETAKSKPTSGFMTSAVTDLDDSGGAEPRLKSSLPKPTSSFDNTSTTVGSALNKAESRIGSTMKRSQVVANRRTPQERLRRYEALNPYQKPKDYIAEEASSQIRNRDVDVDDLISEELREMEKEVKSDYLKDLDELKFAQKKAEALRNSGAGFGTGSLDLSASYGGGPGNVYDAKGSKAGLLRDSLRSSLGLSIGGSDVEELRRASLEGDGAFAGYNESAKLGNTGMRGLSMPEFRLDGNNDGYDGTDSLFADINTGAGGGRGGGSPRTGSGASSPRSPRRGNKKLNAINEEMDSLIGHLGGDAMHIGQDYGGGMDGSAYGGSTFGKVMPTSIGQVSEMLDAEMNVFMNVVGEREIHVEMQVDSVKEREEKLREEGRAEARAKNIFGAGHVYVPQIDADKMFAEQDLRLGSVNKASVMKEVFEEANRAPGDPSKIKSHKDAILALDPLLGVDLQYEKDQKEMNAAKQARIASTHGSLHAYQPVSNLVTSHTNDMLANAVKTSGWDPIQKAIDNEMSAADETLYRMRALRSGLTNRLKHLDALHASVMTSDAAAVGPSPMARSGDGSGVPFGGNMNGGSGGMSPFHPYNQQRPIPPPYPTTQQQQQQAQQQQAQRQQPATPSRRHTYQYEPNSFSMAPAYMSQIHKEPVLSFEDLQKSMQSNLSIISDIAGRKDVNNDSDKPESSEKNSTSALDSVISQAKSIDATKPSIGAASMTNIIKECIPVPSTTTNGAPSATEYKNMSLIGLVLLKMQKETPCPFGCGEYYFMGNCRHLETLRQEAEAAEAKQVGVSFAANYSASVQKSSVAPVISQQQQQQVSPLITKTIPSLKSAAVAAPSHMSMEDNGPTLKTLNATEPPSLQAQIDKLGADLGEEGNTPMVSNGLDQFLPRNAIINPLSSIPSKPVEHTATQQSSSLGIQVRGASPSPFLADTRSSPTPKVSIRLAEAPRGGAMAIESSRNTAPSSTIPGMSTVLPQQQQPFVAKTDAPTRRIIGPTDEELYLRELYTQSAKYGTTTNITPDAPPLPLKIKSEEERREVIHFKAQGEVLQKVNVNETLDLSDFRLRSLRNQAGQNVAVSTIRSSGVSNNGSATGETVIEESFSQGGVLHAYNYSTTSSATAQSVTHPRIIPSTSNYRPRPVEGSALLMHRKEQKSVYNSLKQEKFERDRAYHEEIQSLRVAAAAEGDWARALGSDKSVVDAAKAQQQMPTFAPTLASTGMPMPPSSREPGSSFTTSTAASAPIITPRVPQTSINALSDRHDREKYLQEMRALRTNLVDAF